MISDLVREMTKSRGESVCVCVGGGGGGWDVSSLLTIFLEYLSRFEGQEYQ